MAPPLYDEPEQIQQAEAREELNAWEEDDAGYAIFDFIAIAFAIVLGAIAFEEIHNWSQWVVLVALFLALTGFLIALSPHRHGR